MVESELASEFVFKGENPTETEEKRMERQVAGLARRVRHYPSPRLHLVVEPHKQQRRVEVEARLQLGPLGPSLVSHERAETPDAAVKAAIDDLERQLERHVSKQRGEAAFGVPSRRKFQPPAPTTEIAGEDAAG